MGILASLRSRFRDLFSEDELDSLPGMSPDNELDAELRSHIEHRADDLVRSGIAQSEALRRARVEFGGYVRYREESHAAAGGQLFETMGQDLRIAVRVLRKSPGFALTAMVTLALAIGANAVVFSVMNALILRPLNVPHAESLYALFHAGDAGESYLNYLDLRDRNHSFESVAAFSAAGAGLDTGHDLSRVWVYETTGNYFDTLRQQPYLGRFFNASDEHGANSAPYIVLTYAFWRSHFDSDRGVVGRVVQLNKHPFTIVGVAQPEFHGTLLFFNPDFFVPLVNQEQVLGTDVLNARGKTAIFMAIGHLKANVTKAEAVADLNSVGSYLEKTYPKDNGKLTFTLNRPNLYGDYIGRPVQLFMTAMTLLAGLILLAACANLGSLFAARAADRSREVALRLALGSSRGRILRSLFTEAALISLAGGSAGLLGGMMLLRMLSAWQPFPRWPIHLEVTPDASVYAVALLLTLASGFLFGAVPVRQVLRTNPYEVIKSSAGAGKGMRRVTVRDVLLVIQIAICAVLVTSSLVAVRGLTRSLHNDFGFEVEDRIQVDTDLSMGGYKDDRVPAMQKRMIDALEAIPGVVSVGLADTVPLGDSSIDSNVFADTTNDLRASNAAADPYVFKVSSEYFDAVGTPLLAGRSFTLHDDKSAPRVAVVNREFGRKMFGSAAQAMGRYFKMPDGARVQVVGIAGDGKYASMTEDPQPAMFLPILQIPSSQTYLIVRSSAAGAGHDLQQLGAAVRGRLQELDAGLPIQMQTRYNRLDALLFGPRMAAISLGVLGVMGAMLSITGIFGMAAYSVSRRLRELGIRVALGAQRREVLQAALGRAVKLLAVGSAAGLALGILASRFLAYIVYEATARDPLMLAGVVLAMALLGLVATWIPAQRALRVDPVMLLREE
jgi:predicted permease